MSTGLKRLHICFAAVALVVAPVLLPTSHAHAQNGQPDRQYLVGHWMNETIDLEEPMAEHLVLNGDGTFRTWTVRPDWKSDVQAGRWRVVEKTLFLQKAGQPEASIPITIYKGRLILPNIPNQRHDWGKISD